MVNKIPGRGGAIVQVLLMTVHTVELLLLMKVNPTSIIYTHGKRNIEKCSFVGVQQ